MGNEALTGKLNLPIYWQQTGCVYGGVVGFKKEGEKKLTAFFLVNMLQIKVFGKARKNSSFTVCEGWSLRFVVF